MGNPLVYRGVRPRDPFIGSSAVLAQSAGAEVEACHRSLSGGATVVCTLKIFFLVFEAENVLCRAKVHLEVESERVLCHYVERCFVCAVFAPCTLQAKRDFGVSAFRLIPHADSFCVCFFLLVKYSEWVSTVVHTSVSVDVM